jgi:hypothetical protein
MTIEQQNQILIAFVNKVADASCDMYEGDDCMACNAVQALRQCGIERQTKNQEDM